MLRDLKPDWAFILYTIEDNQMQMIAAVPKLLQGKLHSAAEWVKSICSKGGGRPDFAQGGGEVPADLKEKLQAIEQQLNQL